MNTFASRHSGGIPGSNCMWSSPMQRNLERDNTSSCRRDLGWVLRAPSLPCVHALLSTLDCESGYDLPAVREQELAQRARCPKSEDSYRFLNARQTSSNRWTVLP